jgi:hypothetical protein
LFHKQITEDPPKLEKHKVSSMLFKHAQNCPIIDRQKSRVVTVLKTTSSGAVYCGQNEKSSVVFPRCNSSLWAPGAILLLDQATIISIRNCADHPVIDQFSARLIIGPLIKLTTD